MSSSLVLPGWVGALALVVICAAALARGGWPERVTAAWLGLSWVITLLTRDARWSAPQWTALALDLAFLLFLTLVALRSDRYWPVWAAGFQLLAVVTHGARIIDAEVGDWVYITAGIIWTYLVLFALATGVWGCWRGRLGPDTGLTFPFERRSPRRQG